MGEDNFSSVPSPLPSSLQRPAASSLRLLGLLKQPDEPDPDAFPSVHQLELDEGEVVWSSDELFSWSSPSFVAAYDSADSFSSPEVVRSPCLADSSCSPSPGRARRQFTPERCGLSAALAAEDLLPLVRQRRPAPAAVARATRPVAVAVPAEMEPGAAVLAGRVGCHQSAPVNVPEWPRWRKGPQKADALVGLRDEGGWAKSPEEVEEEDGDEEMVPPHVIVAKSHVTTFSVFEGVGRTLKGRDLRRVRNAVLQKTGFLDI